MSILAFVVSPSSPQTLHRAIGDHPHSGTEAESRAGAKPAQGVQVGGHDLPVATDMDGQASVLLLLLAIWEGVGSARWRNETVELEAVTTEYMG